MILPRGTTPLRMCLERNVNKRGAAVERGDDDVLDRQLRRQALQLASMLPDDPNAAVKVLGYAYELIEDFIRPRDKAISSRSTGGPLRLVVKDGSTIEP